MEAYKDLLDDLSALNDSWSAQIKHTQKLEQLLKEVADELDTHAPKFNATVKRIRTTLKPLTICTT